MSISWEKERTRPMTNRRPGSGNRPGGPGDRIYSGPFPQWVIDWSRRYSGATMFGPVWADYAAPRLLPLLGRPRSAAFKDAALRYTPYALLRVDDDPAMIGVEAQKLQNADLVFLGLGGRGDLVLQAADFKAMLTFADPKQVSADSLRALLTVADARLGDALADCLTAPEFAVWKGPRLRGGALLDALLNAEGRGVTLADGAFVVPDGAADRAVLAARNWPSGHLRVVWVEVEPRELLDGLPGAALLEPLAALDGEAEPYRSYDIALNYYEVSCGALALLMELTTVPSQRHGGFDRTNAAAALAPWLQRTTASPSNGNGKGSALASVQALTPMAPDADVHRRVRAELEALLQLPLRLRTLGEALTREGMPVLFSEAPASRSPAGAVSLDAARGVLRTMADAYRSEMARLLAALGPMISAADIPRLTKQADAMRAEAHERALAELRALAVAARLAAEEAATS